MKRLTHFLVVLVFLGAPLAAAAQDLAREARWRAEIAGSLMVGDAVDIPSPDARPFLGLHTPGAEGKPAVVLVHGRGVHPDHGVIGSLRVALSDAGFTTLSIQMPVLAAEAPAADYHPALFPEAGRRIAAAAGWLRSRGHSRIVLVSHSLGSWMSQHHLESAGRSAFAAWVCMGRSGDLRPLPLPVLDVYGERDFPEVLGAAEARRAAIARTPGSRQWVIAGADHFYAGREQELARALREFIDGLER
jgi:pimeloyl-ACP methyl ester carboxylesterase